MNRCTSVVLAFGLVLTGSALGAEWYAGTEGKSDAKGTQDAPWDLESTLAGQQEVAPGDTVRILGGTYKYQDRKLGSAGYVVKLAGQEGKPIHVRAEPGRRVTVDGGLSVQAPSTHLWIWDLEILVSENLSMSRRVEESGSHPQSYNRPWGGLGIHAGDQCKYINLVIHDNAQGISFWSGATNSEVHGCILYDNGWDAPDRGHGHAIYTQNQEGTKIISDCIMTGGYGYTMHAYGSSRAYVDNYLIEGNLCYDGGAFLIGGGRPSRNIRALENCLYGIGMRIGYSAPYNEDCEVRDNLIVHGSLEIKDYRKVVQEGNVVIGPGDSRPPGTPPQIVLRPNRYDPSRANLAVFNWGKSPTVAVLPKPFLQRGDQYRLMNPREFFGKPVLAGRYEGRPFPVPVQGEFAALVLLKETSD
jgi:hypothetical protein